MDIGGFHTFLSYHNDTNLNIESTYQDDFMAPFGTLFWQIIFP